MALPGALDVHRPPARGHSGGDMTSSEDQVMSVSATLRSHWPEYLIEGGALGTFMLSACLFATLFDYPNSSVHRLLADADLRRVLTGIAMGLTAIAIIYSPFGKRSGAHMNPAVTLTFLRLGKVARWDAVFYVLAQFVGGTLGVLGAWALLGDALAAPPVQFATTHPGERGESVAFAAEFGISMGMMLMILIVSNHSRLARYTGLFAGALVAIYISLEGPLSGMSMNPARSFASAAPAGGSAALWIYFIAPLAGMWCASLAYCALRGRSKIKCAKLLHSSDVRCIHCGYEP